MALLGHIIAVIVIAYIALGLILFLMQPMLLYRPTREVVYTPVDLAIEFENVTLRTSDKIKLSAWYIPANNAKTTILFCHGNGGNMSHRIDSINLFNSLAVNCLIFDYRGYGKSEGKPSEQGTYLDAMAAYKWLTEEKNVSPENIIVFGRSFGASIAAHLASNVKISSLVIESAFTSFVDMGRKLYPYMPVRWFARFKYDTIGCVRKVSCPVMVIHSRSDEIVPFELGFKLYEAANEPKEFVEIYGSHNDGFLVSGPAYMEAWKKWIKFLSEYKQNIGIQEVNRVSAQGQ